MNNEDFHGQILGRLGGIEAEVKGIHKQLKIQNGRISKNDDRIRGVMSWQDKADGRTQAGAAFWFKVTGGIGLVVTVLTFLLNYFF